MHVKEPIDSLQLNDDFSAYQKIETIGILNQQVLVANRAELLLFKRNTAKIQLVSQGTLIR